MISPDGLLAVSRAIRRGLTTVGAVSLEGLVARLGRARPGTREAPREPASIFVLRNNDIGDLLIVTPLFEALRRRFPEARIVAGIGSWNRHVLRHNPYVDEAMEVNAPWFNKYAAGGPISRIAYVWRSPEVARLRCRGFEVGIDVLGSSWGSLLLLRANIPYRLGVRGYAGGHGAAQAVVPFDPAEHVGRRALRFAELLGAVDLPCPTPQLFLIAEERQLAESTWARAGAAGRDRRIVVAPGGGLDVKCWPPERFRELLRRLGERPGLRLLVLGGPKERDLVRNLAAATPAAWAPPEAPGLRETFALVAASDGVICNSSMLMHVAAAFSKPTLALLGPSFPSAQLHQLQWGYPGITVSLGREEGGPEEPVGAPQAEESAREHLRLP